MSPSQSRPVSAHPRRFRRLEIIVVLCSMCLASSVIAQGNPQRVSKAPSARSLYEELAAEHDRRMVFDPLLRDRTVQIDLSGLDFESALHVLNQTTGFFASELSDGTLMVADDTPQKRRQYSTQVVQAIPLENVEVRDVMTALRSIFGLKHVAANQELHQLVVRDEAAVVAQAAALVARIDQPQGEVDIALEVLQLSSDEVEQLVRELASDQDDGALPSRLTASQAALLRQRAVRLPGPSLSVIDGETAALRVLRQGQAADPTGQPITFELGLRLEVRLRTHPQAAEASLAFEAIFTDLVSDSTPGIEPLGPVFSERRLSGQERLASGDSLLLHGLAQKGAAGPGMSELLAGKTLERDEVLLLLTPRIVRQPEYTDEDLRAVCVGTETHFGFCP